MKKGVITILVLIFLPVIGIGIKTIFFPMNALSQSIDTAYEVVDKTMDGDNAIYNYEWFKEQETYIQECLKNEEISKEEYDYFLEMLPEDRTTWAKEDKQEESSLRNSYYALQKLTNKTIEDYNAKSSMVNRAIFKDNLPSNIARSSYVGKQLTK